MNGDGQGVPRGVGSGRQSIFSTFGAEAETLAGLTWWMTAGAVVIFVAVATLIVMALRARRNAITHRQGMRLVLWAGGVVPTVVLLSLLVSTLPQMRPIAVAPGDLRVTVEGEQFWWRIRYRSPGAAELVTANELRIPVGRTVALELEAGDVLHSFWVPGLAGKMDMVPGRTNTLVVRATRAGRFRGQCAEFCGLSHALMAFDVIAMEPAAFDRWLAERRGPARDGAATDPGARAFAAYGCAACHAVRGTAAAGTIGPDLTHVGARTTLGAGILPMDTEHLRRFVKDAPAVKPGARMPAYPHMTNDDATAIARWLESLT
ncbi:cytochrome c oxidase subunit II [uncultured Sphingomonas sp.]|uniref:cytochrome c oxidase subunit II n=1 Tax=uncultured Sphingomonas sp. TaxID=158754 RepID=UPI00258E8355|nr:cytochrome c oxidase subunit II [uncultured Sphingomonas sp.]